MLTVIIPCLNERHNIAECVASARLLGGEILVADCGSNDGTLDFVRASSDCRLIQRAFVNYADFKNWAIPQATQPWVFILDADERVTPELANEIHQVLASDTKEVDAYWIGRRTFFFGHQVRFGPWLNDGVDRLFRRDTCRYGECRVHECLLVDPRRRRKLHQKLIHHTIASYDDYLAKYSKYTRWGAADLWDHGQRATNFRLLVRPFLRFFWLYIARGGFLDGAIGIQTCMLQAFLVTFLKQGRLWEREYCAQSAESRMREQSPVSIPFRNAA